MRTNTKGWLLLFSHLNLHLNLSILLILIRVPRFNMTYFFIIKLSSFPYLHKQFPPVSSIFHKLNLSVEKKIGWWICNHRQGEPPSCCPKNNPGNTSKKLNDMRKFSSTYTYTHAWVCHASVNTVHHSLGAHVFRYFLHTPSHFLLLLLPHHACRGHDTIWQTNIFQPGLLRHVKTTV